MMGTLHTADGDALLVGVVRLRRILGNIFVSLADLYWMATKTGVTLPRNGPFIDAANAIHSNL